MELDDLKQSWQKAAETIKRPNLDIQEILQNSSTSPIAQLKRRFRKGLMLIPAVVAISLIELHGTSTISNLMRWFLLGFCVLIMIYFYLSYRLVSRMQQNDVTIKENLQRQVQFLRTGLKWRLLITRTMFVCYALVLEVFMYLRPDDGLADWHAHSIWFRIGIYLAVFIAGYLISKYATNHRYKKYIVRLEQLASQMEA